MLDDCIFAHGFGYVSHSDDYKLVMVLIGEYDTLESETNVYSLRSNSWRKIDNTPNYLVSGNKVAGAFVCGAIHWVLAKRDLDFESRSCYYIDAFDLATEEYKLVTLPDFSYDDGISNLFVSELGGCLCLGCNDINVSVIDMWVMKDYGARESWSKLLTLSNRVIRIVDCVIPLGYSESGDALLLMLNSEKLLLFNLKKNTFSFVDVRRLPKFSAAVICLESLVYLGKQAENYDGDKEGAKEELEKEDLLLFTKLQETLVHSGCL